MIIVIVTSSLLPNPSVTCRTPSDATKSCASVSPGFSFCQASVSFSLTLWAGVDLIFFTLNTFSSHILRTSSHVWFPLSLEGRLAFYHAAHSWLCGRVGQGCIHKIVKGQTWPLNCNHEVLLGQWLGFQSSSVAHTLSINQPHTHIHTHICHPPLFSHLSRGTQLTCRSIQE